MKPKFRNIDLETNEIKFYPKKKELGAIILELFKNNVLSGDIGQTKQRQLNFLNESGLIFKKREGTKVEFFLSYNTKKIISFIFNKRQFPLIKLANFLEDSVENVYYYLKMFIEMDVFPGKIDDYSQTFILDEESLNPYT
ncbi:MAG: hypothetical protein ACTSRC_19465 [Candidatus Helarchaeota archaeon]